MIYSVSKFTFNLLNKKNIVFNNKEYLNLLISESNKSVGFNIDEKKLKSLVFKFVSNIDITNPSSIIDRNFNKVSITKTTIETDKYFIVNNKENYIDDPNPIKIDEPLVYLYNTHQLEDYKENELYGVSPNVMTTSFLLKENLNKLVINTVVEERRINEIMNVNNWKNYYKASKYLLEDVKDKKKSLKYFIDVHRDSVERDKTTININGKDYVKLYFVIGKENPNYEKNMELASIIDIKLNSKYKGISKGILLKEGRGVDGIYNQNIDQNVLLIEFGGVDNTIEEVNRTVEIFSNVFSEVINGKK